MRSLVPVSHLAQRTVRLCMGVCYVLSGCGSHGTSNSPAAPSASSSAAESGEPPGSKAAAPGGASGAAAMNSAPPSAHTPGSGGTTPAPTTDPLPSAAAGSGTDPASSVGSTPAASSSVSADAIEIEQHLTDVRPEFLDYFWNNLDAEHFKQWFPDEHGDFKWEAAPKAPGDLGAETGASFRTTETIGGNSHELTVKYIDRAMVGDQVTLDYAMVADITIDGQGPVRWIVQYSTDGDWNLLMKQRLETPSTESGDAWRSHLEKRMTNLTGFLKGWFQKDYCETELMSRGERKVTTMGDAISGDFDIVVTQHIGKINQDMMDWWWDNIKDTMRYHRWHPTAHQKFTWITPPKNTTDLAYEVGAVQQIVEIIGDANTLDIGWLTPANLPIELTYEHFVYGSTTLTGTPFGGFLLHEYENDPERGGINMKSTFRLPALAGMPFAEALAGHCTQEMQFLQYFVPAVFAEEYKP